MIGCIGDVFIPNFADDFSKKHPDLFKKTSAFDALYTTQIGAPFDAPVNK